MWAAAATTSARFVIEKGGWIHLRGEQRPRERSVLMLRSEEVKTKSGHRAKLSVPRNVSCNSSWKFPFRMDGIFSMLHENRPHILLISRVAAATESTQSPQLSIPDGRQGHGAGFTHKHSRPMVHTGKS